MTGGRFLSTARAAELLDVSPATLRKWRATRRGPPFHRVGRRVVYAEAALRAWADLRIVVPGGGRDALRP